MYIYSQTIVCFVQELKHTLKIILTREVGLKCYGDRFYNRKQTKSFPLSVVIYNHKPMLGYFDAEFYELGFHEQLMHCKKEQLHDILRHELAHYLAFIEYGPTIQSHAHEFKAICKRYGWGENVSSATVHLEAGTNEESGVLRKVKKLMALGSSQHAHEAEQAMLKSQELLLKHKLEFTEESSDSKIYVQRILKVKKETAKLRAIAVILKTFFVSIVYHRGDEYTHLEILGDAVNVEIAEYVAEVLDAELDHLWDKAKKSTRLKGAVAKNSFFLGIAQGYCNKVEALKKEHTPEVTQALLVLEKQLVDAQKLVYRRLSSRKTTHNFCPSSAALGQKMGQKLNINPALNQQSRNSGKYLS